MRAYLRFAVATAALVISPAVWAADVVGEEPPAPSVPYEEPAASGDWSGPYAGVTAGYGFGRATSDVNGSGSHKGFDGSVFGGVQGQSGQVVYGLEGDVGYDAAKATLGTTTVKGGVDGSLRGRLGYAVTDQLLLYGTAGGAAKHLRINDGVGSDSGMALGWTAGAGIDAKMTEQVFVRGEYRFTDYGAKTLNGGAGAQSVDTRGSRISLGLGVKF